MKDIPESEARALLSLPSDCLEIGDWVSSPRSAYIFHVECGLIREGVFAQLHVDIRYKYRPDTKVTHMVFSVFRKTVHGFERVFQLDINNNPLAAKNIHNLPHCHWGDVRIYDKTWLQWDFQTALAYFTEQAKINFIPPPLIPEFKLK